MSESARVVAPPVPDDVTRWTRFREGINSEDSKLFQIVAMLIATPWLCLAVVTLGPSTVRLVISLLQPLAE
jgi:hypothetical protein